MFSGGFDNIAEDDFDFDEDEIADEEFPDPYAAPVQSASPDNAGPDTPEDTQPVPSPVEVEKPVEAAPKPVTPPPVKVQEPPTSKVLLDTPRTRKAFVRSGIPKKELSVKTLQDFHIPGDLDETQKLRFHHYEARRQDKVNMVLRERARIIAEESNLSGSGDLANYASLQMMEGMLDTEAKKLEKNLRSQLRYHQSVERENVLQLDREKSLEGKLGYRKERQAIARSQFDAKSQQIREVATAKKKHNEELLSSLEQKQLTEQTNHITNKMLEQERLKAFEMEKTLKNAAKSEKWKEKCKEMQRRKEEHDFELELKKEKQMIEMEKKLDEIEKKKEGLAVARKVRHQEESLKLVDAKDKVDRLKRTEEFRRNLIRENLNSQEERIDSLLKLRGEIVEQRKVRIKQASVIKGRAQNIRNTTPGPAHYQPLPSCLNELPVTKIMKSDSKNMNPGSVEFMIKKSKSIPPPGSYDPQVLPNGIHLDYNILDGCKTRIAGEDNKNFLDENVKTFKNNPGPGTYEAAGSYKLRHSVRMVRDYVDTSDKPPKWCKPVQDIPGPDEYVLDKFSKAGRAKAANSMPHLAGALRMASR